LLGSEIVGEYLMTFFVNMCLFIHVLIFFFFSRQSMSNIFIRSAYNVVEGRKLYPRPHGMNFEVERKVGRYGKAARLVKFFI
jgi:hypothetical protein